MPRYLRLLGAQLRLSLLVSAQYRVDFFIDATLEILWTSTALAPLLAVFSLRGEIAGWSFGEALVVVGFFTLLQGLLEGVMNPSFGAVVEHVRKGTLDYVLLVPADAQFMVSTGRFHLWRSVNLLNGFVIFGVAFHELRRAPSAVDIFVGGLLFLVAATLLHAVWTLAMCSVFFAVKTAGITDLLSAGLDAGRWPSAVFQGGTRIVLTYLVPLGLMTTLPASALLGHLDGPMLAVAVVEAVLLTAVARAAWQASLARYASASS